MKKLAQLTLLLILSIPLAGQENSLRQDLEHELRRAKQDSTRIRVLTELAELCIKKDTVCAVDFLNDALRLSKQNDYVHGIGLYYEIMGEMRTFHGSYHNAIFHFEKAREYYYSEGRVDRLADVIVDQGNAYLFMAEYDTALAKYEEAIKLTKDKGYDAVLIRALNNSSIIYKNFGEYEKALEGYQQITELYKDQSDISSLIDIFINIGNVYVLLSDYDNALLQFKTALDHADSLHMDKQKCICLMNSGVIHNKMWNYQQAKTYYEAALEVAGNMDDKIEISKCLTNIGTNYISMEEYVLAEEYIRKGLDLKLELGDKRSISNSYNFLAEIKYFQEDYQEAIKLDQDAIRIKRELNDQEGLSRIFGNIARTYLAMDEKQLAVQYADSALKYSLEIGTVEHSATAYEIKKNAYAAMGLYAAAYRMANLFKAMSDSIMNEHTAQAVNELEVKYNARVLQDENERLVLQAELDQFKLARNRKLIIFILLILILTAVSIILLFLLERRQKRYNKALETKNNVITGQNLKLDKLNRTKDKILSVIAHDLRGTIGNQLTALAVLAREEFRDEEERKVVFSRLANSANLSLGILENLTLWTKIQEGQIQFDPEHGRLDQSFEEIIDSFSESITNKELTLENKIDASAEAIFDAFMLKSIIKNLLSNAIKFTERGGKISVGITMLEGNYRLYIKDNGIGISEHERRQILHGNLLRMRKGTENEKGSGLGLSVVRTFLEFHDSELDIRSSSEEGTMVSFLLPVI